MVNDYRILHIMSGIRKERTMTELNQQDTFIF